MVIIDIQVGCEVDIGHLAGYIRGKVAECLLLACSRYR